MSIRIGGPRPSVRLQNANRVAFLGDSITGLNGTGATTTFENTYDNFTGFLPLLSGGRVQYARSFSNPGFTLAQIRDNALVALLAQPAAQLPGQVVILGGTNDAGLGVSFSLAASMSALDNICTSLLAAGIRPVCCTIPPRGDNTTANQNVGKLNAAIGGYARKNGYALLDFHGALVAVSGGGYTSGLAIADNIHPSNTGMLAMANAAVASGWLSTFPAWSVPLVKSNLDASDLLAGVGLFLSDANADGLADSWATGGAAGYVASIVAPSGGDAAGSWQRVTRASTDTAGTRYIQRVATTTTTAASGDLLALSLRVRMTGATGAYTTGAGVTVGLHMRTAAHAQTDGARWGSSLDTTGVVYLERRAQSDTAEIDVTVNIPKPSTGTVTVDVAQVAVRNLTALGLA